MNRPLLTLVVAAVLATAACREAEDPNVVRASGHVEATDVRVGTKIGGTLDRFTLKKGDAVTLGQEIGRIATVDQELALRAARAERDLADAELRKLVTGFRKEDVASAAADLERARIERDAAERDLTRFQGLLDAGSGTEKSRDDARVRRDAAAKAVAAAEEQWRKLTRGFRSEEIDAARAHLAAAEARMAQIDQQISDATILSPAAGVITEKLVEQGEILPPGTTLVVVTDLASAKLVAWIDEPALGRIRLGQEAEVVTDDGQTRTGHLSVISPRAEFTPKNVQTRDERVKLVYEIEIALDNDDGLFKPGMPAEALLKTSAP